MEPCLPELTGYWPSAMVRRALPGIAPAFGQVGRQAAADQGITAIGATNLVDSLSEAHPTPQLLLPSATPNKNRWR